MGMWGHGDNVYPGGVSLSAQTGWSWSSPGTWSGCRSRCSRLFGSMPGAGARGSRSVSPRCCSKSRTCVASAPRVSNPARTPHPPLGSLQNPLATVIFLNQRGSLFQDPKTHQDTPNPAPSTRGVEALRERQLKVLGVFQGFEVGVEAHFGGGQGIWGGSKF